MPPIKVLLIVPKKVVKQDVSLAFKTLIEGLVNTSRSIPVSLTMCKEPFAQKGFLTCKTRTMTPELLFVTKFK